MVCPFFFFFFYFVQRESGTKNNLDYRGGEEHRRDV